MSISRFTAPNPYIQIYPDIISHIQAHSGITQANSKPCVTLVYSELYIFRILESWHIENQNTAGMDASQMHF